MAGMGPPPKNPRLRQRKNKTSTAATLPMPKIDASKAIALRELPARGPGETPWHPDTLTFWREVWTSPMAGEFIAVDVPGLVILARLVDAFNLGAIGLAAEIRLQRQCFGLTPLDRRRLQWEIERTSAAQRRRPAVPTAGGVRDPRRNLRVVRTTN